MLPWGKSDRMPSPVMEDAVPGWYSTVFKRYAMHAIVQTRLCAFVSGTHEAVAKDVELRLKLYR